MTTRHHPAAVTAAGHATDAADLKQLLAALGLFPNDTTAPVHDDCASPDPSGDPSAMHNALAPTPARDVDTFQAMAVSMHHSGYPTEAITNATGLTADEITALVAATEAKTPETDPAPAATATEPETAPDAVPDVDAAAVDTSTSTPEATAPEIADIDVLLLWAEQHALASVRAMADRIRRDLADLDQRRATEQATAEAEARIAKLRADLEAEEEHLRQLKAGGHRAVTATIETPTPIRPQPSKRSREDLAAIRVWARKHGHQVGVAGVIKASIVAAYDAAHQPTPIAKAG